MWPFQHVTPKWLWAVVSQVCSCALLGAYLGIEWQAELLAARKLAISRSAARSCGSSTPRNLSREIVSRRQVLLATMAVASA